MHVTSRGKRSWRDHRAVPRTKDTSGLRREVPFGLARWEVVVTREQKESTASRDTFAEVSTIKSTMSVQRILDAAESELNTQ